MKKPQQQHAEVPHALPLEELLTTEQTAAIIGAEPQTLPSPGFCGR